MEINESGVILICGIPGSGKTESGRILAEMLGIPFRDLDEIVVQMSGRTIADIFAHDGEAGFRKLEGDALDDLLAEGSPKVIALGGGTLESERARELIRKKSAALIWLKVAASEAARRLESGGMIDERPLLKGLRGTLLTEVLLKLIDMRSGNFPQSDFAVDTDGHTSAEVASLMAQALLGKRTWSL